MTGVYFIGRSVLYVKGDIAYDPILLLFFRDMMSKNGDRGNVCLY